MLFAEQRVERLELVGRGRPGKSWESIQRERLRRARSIAKRERRAERRAERRKNAIPVGNSE